VRSSGPRRPQQRAVSGVEIDHEDRVGSEGRLGSRFGGRSRRVGDGLRDSDPYDASAGCSFNGRAGKHASFERIGIRTAIHGPAVAIASRAGHLACPGP
jgi:hypothetical protein